MTKMDSNKLEAWSLIGRIGHQAADWNTGMTPKMLDNALRDHGVPREAIDTLFHDSDIEARDATREYRDHISNRACRIVRSILWELEDFPEMTILETMQFAQERKIALR